MNNDTNIPPNSHGAELESAARARIDKLVEKLKADPSIDTWQELADELYLYRRLYGNCYIPKLE